MKARALILFAKAPRLGTVKTRLRAAYTDEQVLEIYKSLLERAVRELGQIEGIDNYLCYWPPDAREEMQGYGLEMFEQVDGDLGQRIQAALAWGIRKGYRQVALVGVDVPGLTQSVVRDNFKLLDGGARVVFGPSLDGGYYLVATGDEPPAGLFEGVPWSTERTLEVNMERARGLGLSVALGEALRDVDRPEDLI